MASESAGGDNKVFDELSTLNELIRNITQLAGKNVSQAPSFSYAKHHSTSSTTRVIGKGLTDKAAAPVEMSKTISEPLLLASTAASVALPLAKGNSGRITEVDKDNQRIEVVYAESIKDLQPLTITTATKAQEEKLEKLLEENLVVDATAALVTLQPEEQALALTKNDADDIPPHSPVTTPLSPSLIDRRGPNKEVGLRRQQQQRQLLKKHLEQRNSLLQVVNVSAIAQPNKHNFAEGNVLAGNATTEVTVSELAKVADALKALRNLSMLCTQQNNNNNGSAEGIEGHANSSASKCKNRATFALERKNRVENVLARTHEEVAARTKSASSSRRLRKLRVCLLIRFRRNGLGEEKFSRYPCD